MRLTRTRRDPQDYSPHAAPEPPATDPSQTYSIEPEFPGTDPVEPVPPAPLETVEAPAPAGRWIPAGSGEVRHSDFASFTTADTAPAPPPVEPRAGVSEGDTLLPADHGASFAPRAAAPPMPAPPVSAPPFVAPAPPPPISAPVPAPAPPMQAPPMQAPPMQAPPMQAPPMQAPPVPAPVVAPIVAAPVEAPVVAAPVEAPAAEAVAIPLLDELVAEAVAEVADEIDADEPVAPPSGRPLGELLVSRGLVSEEQLNEALAAQTTSGKRLGNILVELGFLRERVLTDVLAEQLGMSVVDLSRAEIDPEIVALLSEKDARRLGALPTHRVGSRIEVAVADPLTENLDKQLIEILGSLVRIKLAVHSDLDQAIDRCYAPSAELGDALRMFEARLEERKAAQAPDTVVQTVVDENAPIVKIVNVILEQAVRDRASDVHIEPMGDSVRVRVRTDGALHKITTLPGPMGPSLVSRIKVMSDMNIVERRRPQDGQMAVTIGNRDLDVRVSTTPTAFGEKCVMRILDKTKAVIRLPELGMAQETYDRYYDLIRSPYGMVICAGPTGSGKTTTLYATLTAINNDEINVVTIEDPVEYVFPTINQIQVNEPAGLTFASCLRSVLRQDPDAILVGEIRDVETARIATQAALTGHFVVSSLHATDATSALHRFMDMGIESFLIASSLLGVVGQRLVRRVCEHCAELYTPTPEERSFFLRGGGSPDKDDFVLGVGCNFCGHTGYFDRSGIYEVLAVTDEMKELIVTDAPHKELRALAIEQGMTTLRDQAIRLVTENQTSIAEVLRTVYVL